MKKDISKIILIVSVIGMILVGISLTSMYKSDVVVNDVYGSRSSLGDMSILLQKRGGVFQTDEILISKENETLNKFVKQGDRLMNLTKDNIENRNLFKYQYNKSLIFEDENSVGIFNSYIDDYEDNQTRMIGKVSIKNKESGDVESFEIDMGNSIDINKEYTQQILPVKKEGDILYVATMYSYYTYSEPKESMENNQFTQNNCDSTYLNLYKLNLAEKTSRQVLSKEYNGSDLSINGNYGFAYNDKAYFIVDKKRETLDGYNTNLFEFDIKSKEINLIDLGGTSEALEIADTVENDEILLLSQSTETDSYGKIEKKIRALLVDLNNRTLKYNYKLDMDYSIGELSSDRFRRYDNKIYAVSSLYYKRTDYEQNRDLPYTFYVFDEKGGKKLYEGNIEINSNYSVNMGIVNKDEI